MPDRVAFRQVTVRAGKVVSQKVVCQVGMDTFGGLNVNIPAVFSPDGRHVVLTDGREAEIGDLALLDVSGGTFRKLTQGGRYFHYAWSPSGRHLLALSDGFRIEHATGAKIPGRYRLSLLDTQTGREEVVDEQAHTAAWSLDGKTVVYSRMRIGQRVAGREEFATIPPPPGLVRDYLATSVTDRKPRLVTEQQVDTLLGVAYREALRVYRSARGGEYFTPVNHPPILVSPDGGRALVNDARPPSVVYHTRDQVRTVYVVVDAGGSTKRDTLQGGVAAYRWSRDGHRVYAHRPVEYRQSGFLAINARTGKTSRFPLNDDWGMLIACHEATADDEVK